MSKAMFIVIAVVLAAINLPWFITIATVLALAYLPYYVIRNVVGQVMMQPNYEQQHRDSVKVVTGRPMTRTRWRGAMRRELKAMPSIRRMAQLNTSIIVAIISIVVTVAVAAIFTVRGDGMFAAQMAPLVAVGTTSLVATVGFLGLGRYWERDEGDAVTRRLAAGGVGALVGSAAMASREFLMLPSDRGLVRDIDFTGVPELLYQHNGVTGAAMVVYFALLFALLRTWRPVDPLRRKRLSVWGVAVAVIAAWGVHQIVPIPQPFGMLVAGVTTIAAQFAAPWIHPQTPPSQIEGERFEVVDDSAVIQRRIV